MKKTKTWIITGASRGFGLEISKAVLASGDNVAILDISDVAQAIRVAAQTVVKFGSFDVLAINGGF
jgi:NAD(P)-dependent dehydrogenase (short-subunit alcohol dehydrogenase family)